VITAARRLRKPCTWWASTDGSGITIRIRYRIPNARLAAGAVSGGGEDQAYDGWRVVSRFEFQQWVESGYSILFKGTPFLTPTIRRFEQRTLT
jgi:hypothetical protein